MNIAPIKYKNYIWPHNPEKLNIIIDRSLKEIEIPFKGSLFQEYGRKKRIITGSGSFFGDNCIDQYNQLFNVFKKSGSGYLSIPNIPSFLAFFKSFDILQNDASNVIHYSFEFWEDTNLSLEEDSFKEHIILNNETLWDIALRYDIDINTLIELNKNIKNPNELVAGKKVRLS